MNINAVQIKVASFLKEANGVAPDESLTLYLAALVLDMKIGDIAPVILSYVAAGAARAEKLGLSRQGDMRNLRALVRILKTECGK